jgi:putative two-component system response regulator
MSRMFADMQMLLSDRSRLLGMMARLHLEALLRLALAAESRDGETGIHIVRLGQIAGVIAEEMTGDREFAERLCQAAPMHDIGKIGIPDVVLKKPGKLTAEEMGIMRQHPEIGARILGNSEHSLFALAAEVALHHHEKYDGSGYPFGLVGKDIPLSARIVALADVYDALMMDRVYRRGLPLEQVLAMIREQSGRHFDPAVVDSFFRILPRVEEVRERVNHKFSESSLVEEGVAAFEPGF